MSEDSSTVTMRPPSQSVESAANMNSHLAELHHEIQCANEQLAREQRDWKSHVQTLERDLARQRQHVEEETEAAVHVRQNEQNVAALVRQAEEQLQQLLDEREERERRGTSADGGEGGGGCGGGNDGDNGGANDSDRDIGAADEDISAADAAADAAAADTANAAPSFPGPPSTPPPTSINSTAAIGVDAGSRHSPNSSDLGNSSSSSSDHNADGLGILLQTIEEYKSTRHRNRNTYDTYEDEDHDFEHFLQTMWPDDYRLYKRAMDGHGSTGRSYHTWKCAFDAHSASDDRSDSASGGTNPNANVNSFHHSGVIHADAAAAADTPMHEHEHEHEHEYEHGSSSTSGVKPLTPLTPLPKMTPRKEVR